MHRNHPKLSEYTLLNETFFCCGPLLPSQERTTCLSSAWHVHEPVLAAFGNNMSHGKVLRVQNTYMYISRLSDYLPLSIYAHV